MNRKARTSYLSYIEETPKHTPQLVKIAKTATRNAISIAKKNNISITYIENGTIFKEDSHGVKVILGKVTATKRLKKGLTFEI